MNMIAERIKPDVAIVTDVCHDTNTPMIKKIVEGDLSSGKGPVLSYGPAVQNNLLKFIINEAKDRKLATTFKGNRKNFIRQVHKQEADINQRDLGGTQVWKFCAEPVAKFNTFNLAKVNTRSAHLSQNAFRTLQDWLEPPKRRN